MATKVFMNLAVKDLKKSMDFFKQMGYTFNPQFTDETAACMVISEDIYAMLLTHPKFKQFTSKEISDSAKTTEVMIALSCESKEAVNSTMENALKGGAKEYRDPMDYGFMFQRTYEDLDGHIWELIYMDMSKFPKQ